jgi:hypothetical protein
MTKDSQPDPKKARKNKAKDGIGMEQPPNHEGWITRSQSGPKSQPENER